MKFRLIHLLDVEENGARGWGLAQGHAAGQCQAWLLAGAPAPWVTLTAD